MAVFIVTLLHHESHSQNPLFIAYDFMNQNSFRDYAVIIFGMALYAIGFTVFILPHKIVVGGMAGFSSLIFFASGERIPVAVTMYSVNILMLVIWYRTLGSQFVIRTVIGATILSAMIGAIENYFTSHPPIVSDATMSVLVGSAICGVGIGLYYAHKASSGGTDIVVAIFEKKKGVSIGRTMLIIDATIVTCSFFLPFDGDLDARIQARAQTITYGWASILIYSFIANYIVGLDKQTQQFIIVSQKWEELAHAITHHCNRGLTTIDARGYWTGENRKLLIVWCRQYDSDNIYGVIQQIDPQAIVIQSEARNVYGNGFDRLKTTKKVL